MIDSLNIYSHWIVANMFTKRKMEHTKKYTRHRLCQEGIGQVLGMDPTLHHMWADGSGLGTTEA